MRGFDETFLIRKESHPRRTKRHAIQYTEQLKNDNRVVWAEQQIARVRVKRDLIKIDNKRLKHRSSDPLERGKKLPLPHEDRSFNDELWTRQWYLHDTRNIPTLPK